jgi:hypothetical protein
MRRWAGSAGRLGAVSGWTAEGEQVVGTLKSLVFGGVAERLVPVLHTPVEDIIYEVLDQKGLPSRSEVRDLRNKLERLETSVSQMTEALEGIRGQMSKVTVAAEKASTAAPLRTMTAQKICIVDGCETKVRAKGYCGKHYQKWKRGTL